MNFSCLYLYSFEYLQIPADDSKDGYFLQNIKQSLLSSRNLRQRVSDTNTRGQGNTFALLLAKPAETESCHKQQAGVPGKAVMAKPSDHCKP